MPRRVVLGRFCATYRFVGNRTPFPSTRGVSRVGLAAESVSGVRSKWVPGRYGGFECCRDPAPVMSNCANRFVGSVGRTISPDCSSPRKGTQGVTQESPPMGDRWAFGSTLPGTGCGLEWRIRHRAIGSRLPSLGSFKAEEGKPQVRLRGVKTGI